MILENSLITSSLQFLICYNVNICPELKDLLLHMLRNLAFAIVWVSSVQSLSGVRLFVIPWMEARQASLSITNSRSLPKLMSIKSVMPSSHLILCHPLLLLPPIPPSIRVFSSESALPIRWPKYWSFSFSISPSSEHPGLISFRMDWLDLLAVQGTLKSFLQHHSSKASILPCSAFFAVQLSYLYMATGKTIAVTRQTFVGKVMSLLFNMLSRLIITFLPRNKSLFLMKVKEEREKVGLKLNIQKTKIWAHHFMANRWENSGNSERLFIWVPKSLQMVIAAMKLKDTYSLEEKLWPT